MSSPWLGSFQMYGSNKILASTATMESLLQRIEEAVKCTICNEIFVNPTILTCNDTFCRRCLEGMVVDGCINCATCSKATILPEGGIEQLDLNGMAKSIVDILLQVTQFGRYICERIRQNYLFF